MAGGMFIDYRELASRISRRLDLQERKGEPHLNVKGERNLAF